VSGPVVATPHIERCFLECGGVQRRSEDPDDRLNRRLPSDGRSERRRRIEALPSHLRGRSRADRGDPTPVVVGVLGSRICFATNRQAASLLRRTASLRPPGLRSQLGQGMGALPRARSGFAHSRPRVAAKMSAVTLPQGPAIGWKTRTPPTGGPLRDTCLPGTSVVTSADRPASPGETFVCIRRCLLCRRKLHQRVTLIGVEQGARLGRKAPQGLARQGGGPEGRGRYAGGETKLNAVVPASGFRGVRPSTSSWLLALADGGSAPVSIVGDPRADRGSCTSAAGVAPPRPVLPDPRSPRDFPTPPLRAAFAPSSVEPAVLAPRERREPVSSRGAEDTRCREGEVLLINTNLRPAPRASAGTGRQVPALLTSHQLTVRRATPAQGGN
jgi:hypothetical protein